MALLDSDTLKQLKDVFKRLDKEVKIVNFVSETNEKSNELKSFLEELSVTSDKIVIENIDFDNNPQKVEEFGIDRIPAMTFVNHLGEKTQGKFHGIPGGHEINSFIITILNVAKVGKDFDTVSKKRLEAIDKTTNLKVFVTLACHYCPDVVVATQMMAINNRNISAEMIDIAIFPQLAEKYSVRSVPTIVYNDKEVTIGAKNSLEILSKIESL